MNLFFCCCLIVSIKISNYPYLVFKKKRVKQGYETLGLLYVPVSTFGSVDRRFLFVNGKEKRVKPDFQFSL